MSARARLAALALGVIIGLLSLPGVARTVVIDDAGSSALESQALLRWQSAAPHRGAASNLMQGSMTVRLRLNVMPWLHHSGRIYLALPAQAPGPLSLSWTAQQRLLSGRVQSGNRVLVYSGPITSPFLEDTLHLTFTIDGTLVQRGFPVTVQFEMDEA